MAAALEARLRAMAIGDVEAAISGGDVEAVRRWLETGGDVGVCRRPLPWQHASGPRA